MKHLWFIIVALFILGHHARAMAAEPQRPNIIVIFADDQGYQDLGCFGAPRIKTPNIDELAKQGMRFTDFHSAATVCTPSRAGLLTGRYPVRSGMAKGVLFPYSKTGMSPDEITIAEVLKGVGYSTAAIGKWHLGHQDQFLPTSQGFDSYYGVPYSNDMWLAPEMKLAAGLKMNEGFTLEQIREIMAKAQQTKNKVPLVRGNEVIEFPADQTTLTRRYTEEARAIITKNRGNPFFIYLAHSMPHIPLFASDAFKGKSAGGLYGDTIEEIDWSVGEIVKCLKENGVDGNTLIVFTSDNGPWLTMRQDGGSALPLRNGKGSTFEGGLRVPCVMSWPGNIPAGTACNELASTMDLLPTISAIVGRALPADRPIDGKNILDLTRGIPGAKTPHDVYLYYSMGGVLSAIRQGDWKLHFEIPCMSYATFGEPAEYLEKLKLKPYAPELYNLREDIGETRNLAADHPEIVVRMKALVESLDIAKR